MQVFSTQMDSIRDSVTLLSRPETTVSRTERGADQMALNVTYAVRNVFKRTRILMKESFWISSYIIVATRSFFLTEFYRNKFLKIRLKKIPNKFYL